MFMHRCACEADANEVPAHDPTIVFALSCLVFRRDAESERKKEGKKDD